MNKKSRIAFILPSLRGGGAERVIINIALGLKKAGFEIDIVLVSKSGDYIDSIPSDIGLFDLNASRALTSIPSLIAYIHKRKPHVLISSLPHINMVTIVSVMFARTQPRTVIIEHNTLSQSVEHATSIKGKVLPLFMRPLYRRSDRIVAVSKGVADDLSATLKLQRSKIQVIYNPVVTPILHSLSEEQQNHPWFTTGEPPVILSIGRLTQAKGFDTLIHAFSIVRKQIRARLIILGEGKDRDTLETLIKNLNLCDDISLPGFVDNPYSFLRRSTVFVLSSLWEGLPTVLIEALACGVPVVSTDCPSGPREILDDGLWGTLVPENDKTALANGITDILTTKQLPISRNAWSRFSLEKTIPHYVRLIEGL